MSNKTPKVSAKKIKWALSLALAGLLILVAGWLGSHGSGTQTRLGEGLCTGTGAQLKDSCFSLERADTAAKRQLGLSGREKLDEAGGMLFIFDSPGRQCVWMKDMKFGLDIIWVNEQKKVIKIEKNVTPDTYPQEFCSDNTKYVIEINSGLAQKMNLAIGDGFDTVVD